MTALTPNFSLPYPTALDEPCLFAQQWCEFTEAMQGVFDGLDSTINRTVDVIPIARLQVTSPITLVSGEPIPFDTLSVNTANWVDFDASRSEVTVNRAGRFVHNLNIIPVPTGNTANTLLVSILGSGNTTDSQTDFGPNPMGFNVEVLYSISVPTVYHARLTNAEPSILTVTINEATYSIWWHADTATP